MFAFQRELANNWSLNVDWIQRWFRDATTDQNCYGLPCNTVGGDGLRAERASSPTSGRTTSRGTGDDRRLTFYDVAAGVSSARTRSSTPTAATTSSVDCAQRYKALGARRSASGCRTAGRCRARTSGRSSTATSRASRTNTTTVRGVLRLHQPEQPARLRCGTGRGAQRPAARVQAARQLPGAVGHHRRRELPGAERPAARSQRSRWRCAQGSRGIPMEPRGTYRADFLNLLSLRGRQARHDSRQPPRVVHRAKCTTCSTRSAGQNSYGVADAGLRQPGRVRRRPAATTSYFGRVQEIVAPRVLKIGVKFDF